ncbi:hypothetical protein BO85DRAFT_265923 [Aspergillus piperis CBS 112811]|uniref:Uncharacterized protein n=1 Tax=Aspergillus piperis CBS 112811 TaxID=1448313 RepID=A0A8G1VMU6_9EURO|nr:hypothetical protein BO85DRAFT_265923 [Aspergillus piperis CBS 112811]RAH59224.1 hypothetical protein BO85DRAFT_265923 [Aspergillus piperis CBS 112811]
MEKTPKRTGRRNRDQTVRRGLKEERTRGGRRALSVEGLRMSREEREKGKKDTEGGRRVREVEEEDEGGRQERQATGSDPKWECRILDHGLGWGQSSSTG